MRDPTHELLAELPQSGPTVLVEYCCRPVFDIACGTGALLSMFAPEVDALFGIDLDPAWSLECRPELSA